MCSFKCKSEKDFARHLRGHFKKSSQTKSGDDLEGKSCKESAQSLASDPVGDSLAVSTGSHLVETKETKEASNNEKELDSGTTVTKSGEDKLETPGGESLNQSDAGSSGVGEGVSSVADGATNSIEHKCAYCKYATYIEADFLKHIKVHLTHYSRMHACGYCSRKGWKRADIKRHCRIKHPNLEVKVVSNYPSPPKSRTAPPAFSPTLPLNLQPVVKIINLAKVPQPLLLQQGLRLDSSVDIDVDMDIEAEEDMEEDWEEEKEKGVEEAVEKKRAEKEQEEDVLLKEGEKELDVEKGVENEEEEIDVDVGKDDEEDLLKECDEKENKVEEGDISKDEEDILLDEEDFDVGEVEETTNTSTIPDEKKIEDEKDNDKEKEENATVEINETVEVDSYEKEKENATAEQKEVEDADDCNISELGSSQASEMIFSESEFMDDRSLIADEEETAEKDAEVETAGEEQELKADVAMVTDPQSPRQPEKYEAVETKGPSESGAAECKEIDQEAHVSLGEKEDAADESMVQE